VRVEVQSISGGVARVWYIGEREPLLAAGVADEEMLAGWLTKTDKVSRPRRVERTQVEDYWHYSGAGRVQRFRVLMVRTLENARQLPGFRNALAMYRNRMHEYDERIRAVATGPRPPRQRPARKHPSYLWLVIDNTRRAD